MKKFIIFLLLIVAGLVLVYYQNINRGPENNKLSDKKESAKINNTKPSMKITSSAFSNNGKIPKKYTCDGENFNPPLQFQDVPREARSLILIVDDPDAPSKTWVHWVVYNIDPRVKEVKENSVPDDGVVGTTDFGRLEYGGPCPPSGTHRYFFKLYALDTILNAPNGLIKQQILEKVRDRVIEEAELVGLYNRQ